MPNEILDDGNGTVTLVERETQTLFRTEDPGEILQRTAETASFLKDFVVKQGLTTRISSNEYLLVEAWQMLGMMLGVSADTITSEPIEGGWQSRVELHDRSGRLVGSGEAECLDSERRWGSSEDNARRSMAQTRALGKAYRNTFGFIAKAAGFEPTPSEEMPQDHHGPQPTFGPTANEQLYDEAVTAIENVIPNIDGQEFVRMLAGTFDNGLPEVAARTLKGLAWWLESGHTAPATSTDS